MLMDFFEWPSAVCLLCGPVAVGVGQGARFMMCYDDMSYKDLLAVFFGCNDSSGFTFGWS